MRTAVSTLRLFEPRTLKEAFVMLRDEGPLTPLAGCTDVFVNLNFGTAKETRYLNLWNLPSLRRIRIREGTLSIGALATYADLIRSPLVATRLPILAAAAREVGGAQIQNRLIRGVGPGTGVRNCLRKAASLDLHHRGGWRFDCREAPDERRIVLPGLILAALAKHRERPLAHRHARRRLVF